MPGQSTIIGKTIFSSPGFPTFFIIFLIGISDTFLAYRPCYRLLDFNTFLSLYCIGIIAFLDFIALRGKIIGLFTENPQKTDYY